MVAKSYSIAVGTAGEGDFIDITARVEEAVGRSSITEGILSVSVRSTTSAVVVCENEKGLLLDLAIMLARLAPSELRYEHDSAWGDGNGRSHVKAALCGQAVTLPVAASKLVKGRWQSIFLLEFDVRARERTVDVVIVG